MDDAEFATRAEATLQALERSLEASAVDADVELRDGGILELEFPDGGKIIVNRHAVAREIWVAARAGGYHFRWDGAAWRDTRDGTELFAALSRLISSQGGQPVVLRA